MTYISHCNRNLYMSLRKLELARTHAVVVVLRDEDHGEVPQLAHVGGLPDLSLVGGTVSVARHRDRRLLTCCDAAGETTSKNK